VKLPHQHEDASTIRRPIAAPRNVVGRTYEVVVAEGPDAGARLSLDAAQPSRLLVGQSPACHLVLQDRLVSRRHAAFDVTERGVRLVDLGSTNGTFVGGLAIAEVFLRGGELVRVGETILRVDVAGERKTTPLTHAHRFGRMLGGSIEMRRLYPLCERVAASDVPVVIEGETGTGKEVLAESLHVGSPRANSPFIVFDCTATPPSLLESTLFGHERGAFTGAVAAHTGVFEEANGGTLLIDEIGDLDLALQPKLLRAIERREVRRVGGDRWIKVDVRIIAATRRDLDAAVQTGGFRNDLFFRLAIGRVELPPLRERRGDIALLARHFWRTLGGVGEMPDDQVARLETYSWPGNVRELHNAVARQLALGEFAAIPPAPPSDPSMQRARANVEIAAEQQAGDVVMRVLERDLPLTRARNELVAEFERLYVARVLAQHGGNVTKAATASGIGRRYFQMLRARK
jgi:DNA-binding NtrC family response regulator